MGVLERHHSTMGQGRRKHFQIEGAQKNANRKHQLGSFSYSD